MEDGLTAYDFQRAIEVQDSNSLYWVGLAFSAVLPRILAEARNKKKGTEWVINTHPISVLYTNKMVSLTGECVSGGVIFDEAYRTCIVRSKKKDGKRL